MNVSARQAIVAEILGRKENIEKAKEYGHIIKELITEPTCQLFTSQFFAVLQEDLSENDTNVKIENLIRGTTLWESGAVPTAYHDAACKHYNEYVFSKFRVLKMGFGNLPVELIVTITGFVDKLFYVKIAKNQKLMHDHLLKNAFNSDDTKNQQSLS
jgi:hypothetical protein